MIKLYNFFNIATRLTLVTLYILALLVTYDTKIISGLSCHYNNLFEGLAFIFVAPILVISQLNLPFIGSMYSSIFFALIAIIVNNYVVSRLKAKELLFFIFFYCLIFFLNFALVLYSLGATMASSKGNVLFVANPISNLCWIIIIFSNIFLYSFWIVKLNKKPI